MLADLAVNDAGSVHRRWSRSPGRTCPRSRASTPPATPPDRLDIAAGELSAPRRDTVLTNARSERVRSLRGLSRRVVRQRAGPLPRRGPAGRPRGPGRARPPIAAVRPRPRPRGRSPTPRPPSGTPTCWRRATADGVVVTPAATDVLAALSDTVHPQGLRRRLRPGRPPARRRPAASTAAHARPWSPCCPRSATRATPGTVVRAADAAGADAVVLTDESVDVYNPKCVRATAGSLFHLPVAVGAPSGRPVERAASAAAARPRGRRPTGRRRPGRPARRRGRGSGPLVRPHGLDLRQRGVGPVRAERCALADHVVRVPIHGRAESLNLATAAAVCLYASARVRRAA